MKANSNYLRQLNLAMCTSILQGSVPDELGTACICDQAVWQESTNTCSTQCPGPLQLVQLESRWACECPGCTVQVHDGENIACTACQTGFVAALDVEGTKSCVASVEAGPLSKGLEQVPCI